MTKPGRYTLNEMTKLSITKNNTDWYHVLLMWRTKKDVAHVVFLPKIFNLNLTRRKQSEPNWGTLAGPETSKMPMSKKTKKARELFQSKGNYRNMTIKYNAWSTKGKKNPSNGEHYLDNGNSEYGLHIRY